MVAIKKRDVSEVSCNPKITWRMFQIIDTESWSEQSWLECPSFNKCILSKKIIVSPRTKFQIILQQLFYGAGDWTLVRQPNIKVINLTSDLAHKCKQFHTVLGLLKSPID